MNKLEEYKKYIKKCEMLGTKMFEFERKEDSIVITKYIPNNEPYRIVKIPNFVDKVLSLAFSEVTQGIRIEGHGLKSIDFCGYKGDKIDMRRLDTSKIEYMNGMFMLCTELRKIDISNFDTSNTQDMTNMFYGCNKIEKLEINNFNTEKVIDIYGMFNGCEKLKELDINGFDTSNVTNMSSMFFGCKSIKELDLSNLDTNRVISMYSMFNGCSSLEKLDISKFKIKEFITKEFMFNGCVNLRIIITNEETARWLETNRSKIDLNNKCEIVVKE